MILTARRSLVSKMSRNQAPRLELFFLNIHVRRAHLVHDSLTEVGHHSNMERLLLTLITANGGSRLHAQWKRN